jgi:hypothetical protein
MRRQVDPRCRVRRASIRLKKHVGPVTDAQRKAAIAKTAELMAGRR